MKWFIRKIAANKTAVLAVSVALAAIHPAASDVVAKTAEAVAAAIQLTEQK